MTCFGVFCRPGSSEGSKHGAYVPYDHGDGERPRAKIPWVWSRKFHQNYQLGQVLGHGSFAVVHEGTRTLLPHESFAIKVVQRNRLSHKQVVAFKDEVQILADLQHDNIVRLFELYKEPGHFFVVMEKLEGGELFDRLCEISTYNEKNARDAMRIILEAVAYCHAHKVAHRDLKPENLLLKDHTDDTKIKVVDFGFAKIVEKPNSLSTLCGSPMYTAPEIINYKPYDERVDNWSLGVILFTILGGYPPFYQPTTHETYQQIRQVDYKFHPEYWSGISRDAKNLIQSLLTFDMDRRITAEAALSHPWMTGRGDDLQRKSLWGRNLEQLKKFNWERKKRAAAQAIRNVSMYWLLTRV